VSSNLGETIESECVFCITSTFCNGEEILKALDGGEAAESRALVICKRRVSKTSLGARLHANDRSDSDKTSPGLGCCLSIFLIATGSQSSTEELSGDMREYCFDVISIGLSCRALAALLLLNFILFLFYI
jgi:hypothetical protein